ncbi:MAG: NYN domain-containing protein [Acidobacteriota bacterium]
MKIAVFVDFDNIEIGVKTKMNRRFDIGAVLEAVKERGEVVTKIAYGNWKHAEGYSREMAGHAVQMVQRNTTPGGDKNGADINLALDALEMAFIRDHINTFVIVGGDSDFIALVEKLKQYDKKVFIVGGRSFTSSILQRNCHEFIAYENLFSVQSGARKDSGKEQSAGRAPVEKAMPLIRRALKILSDREVSPQLGLLKSTLLQLDSTFSERDYGAGSFREFIQKLAHAKFVTLKQVDRSLLVELRDGEGQSVAAAAPRESQETAPAPERASEAMRLVETILREKRKDGRWPMYLRNFRQFLKSGDSGFDEQRFGFSGIQDLAREAQRAGLLRVERNRQGIPRVWPGERLDGESADGIPAAAPSEDPAAQAVESEGAVEERMTEGMGGFPAAPAEVASEETAEAAAEPEPKKKRKTARRRTAAAKPATKRKRTPKSARKTGAERD